MSFGELGYQDGQRIAQQDASVAAWTLNGTFTTNQLSPVIPTQGFSGLQIFTEGSSGTCVLTWGAYLDDALNFPLAGSHIVISTAITGNLAACIPAIGPYMFLTTSVLGGPNYLLDPLTVMLTNKLQAVTSLPDRPYWKPATVNIPALTNLAIPAPFYWTGATLFHVSGGGTALVFALQALDSGNAWNTFASLTPGAGIVVDATAIIWPLSPVRLVITNTSATIDNSTWGACITPDLKGIG